MTKQYPDWVYDEMAKRMSDEGVSDYDVKVCREFVSHGFPSNAALAKLIFETQEAPEDPYLPVARKVAAEAVREGVFPKQASKVAAGEFDDHPNVQFALRAIHALLEHQEANP